MSESGSDSSSDGYEGHRGQAATPDGSPTSHKSHATRKSSESSSSQSSTHETPLKSPHSSPHSPASPISPRSVTSHHSSHKSPSASPKSYRSGNSIDSPRSDHSSAPDSINKDEAQSCKSGPSSPKSLLETPTSPKSEINSEPHPIPSGRSSVKSNSSGHSSPKSFKILHNDEGDEEKDNDNCDGDTLSSTTKSLNDKKKKAIADLDSEQISDGDIDDDSDNDDDDSDDDDSDDDDSDNESIKLSQEKNQTSVPMTHGEDLSDVSDLDSLDSVDVKDNDDNKVDNFNHNDDNNDNKSGGGGHGKNDGDENDKNENNVKVENVNTLCESIEHDKSSQDIIENDKKCENKDAIVPMSIIEESEQLDFEAEGQWKDEREENEPDSIPTISSETNQVNKKTIESEKNVNDSPTKTIVNNENDNIINNKNKIKESGELEDDEDDGEVKDKEDGEKVESELEEGELSDGDDARPEETEPRPVCRFYSRGQCTWGVSCRFLHPGVTDKGNYTMFEMVRPMAYPSSHSAPVPSHEFRPHIERPSLLRSLTGSGSGGGNSSGGYPPHMHSLKNEELPSESAWERGLRHAKEMMRKANKRKESDMDFEEKKMNLSLGQDELEREAGYYVKPASPEIPNERWPIASKEMSRRFPPPLRGSPDRYDDPDGYYSSAGPGLPPHSLPPPPSSSSSSSEYYRRLQYKGEPRPGPDYRERPDYHGMQTRNVAHSVSPPPQLPYPLREREREREQRDRDREQRGSGGYYEKYEKKQKRPMREVIVERIPQSKAWRDDEREPPITSSMERGRGDEWADPWMRRKSPSTVRRTTSTTTAITTSTTANSATVTTTNSSRRSRRQSYSSGSSYTSSSSSRSSSRSSYTSYDSLSRSRSPSPSTRTRGHIKSKHLPPSSPPVNTSTLSSQARGTMLMNPPAPSSPSPRIPKGTTSPTIAALHRRAGLNPPAPSPLVSQRHHEKIRDKASVSKVIKGGRSRSRSLSSHSSSGSESSGSSSDSSESSYSSSSSVEVRRKKASSPHSHPPISQAQTQPPSSSSSSSTSNRKEIMKHIEGTKNSNSKQHIKVAQKTTMVSPTKKLDRSSTIAGKKRTLEPSPSNSSDSKASIAALAAKAAKKASSRREELLKQLKAVEDAIARKRSKPEIAGKN